MPIPDILGLQKFRNLMKIIKFHGGLVNTALAQFRYDDIKFGTLKGVDKFGNKYFENNYYFIGRSRWVIYSDQYGFDYDASQIPAEWYGWLHYKTDLIPSEDKSRPNYKWMSEHTQNLSGTSKEYVPYSTTSKKIEPWVPPSCKK